MLDLATGRVPRRDEGDGQPTACIVRQLQLPTAPFSSRASSSVVVSMVFFTVLAVRMTALSNAFSSVGSPIMISAASSPLSSAAASLSSLRHTGPKPSSFGVTRIPGPIHSLDDIGLPVLVIDDGRVEFPNHVILVEPFGISEISLCGFGRQQPTNRCPCPSLFWTSSSGI